MKDIYRLDGVVQDYAWGGTEFIANLLGIKPGKKMAEYWLGTHEKGTAGLLDAPEKDLQSLIQANQEDILGKTISQRFGRLPYLFKVLDVHDMLSIQVHPSKEEAENGFARENKAGIPLSAPERNYRDDNHKPEVMVAQSEFWLLHGFLPARRLVYNLNANPELAHLKTIFRELGYEGLYAQVMNESPEQTNETLRPLIDRILPEFEKDKLDKRSPDYWAAKAYKTFCSSGDLDKGIYSIYFFNIVRVMPGEGLFQDAGIPHAYLEGQTMELMANSDNVLRGGLTAKHVDVPELLTLVKYEETRPAILTGLNQPGNAEKIYKTDAPDFELSNISLGKNDKYEHSATSPEIIIAMEGEATVVADNVELVLHKGESIFIKADKSYTIQANQEAKLYKASVPMPKLFKK